jgi:hypothetical protein
MSELILKRTALQLVYTPYTVYIPLPQTHRGRQPAVSALAYTISMLLSGER